jgi:two-component system, chemotaxis family, protein-glutamate methylesterase/glutaminase
MPGHDILVVGASAGGVEALSKLVKGFPSDLPASIFVVLHLSPHGTSWLPKILTREGVLPAVHPKDGERIQKGRIYVAPPDQHLLIKRGLVRVVHGPRENGSRPAIDPLFRSAARAYGKRVVGIVLSGGLDDGTAGLIAVKRQGGLAVVQDPNEALYPSMPQSAIVHNDVDHVLPLSEIASVVVRLVHERVEEEGEKPVSDDMETEVDIAELDMATLHAGEKPGIPSRFSCPECNGVLWEIDDENLIRFRCRVGHAYSTESLLAVQSDSVEGAIWAGLRALEENAALMRRMSKQMRSTGNERSALKFDGQALSALQRAEVLRQLILDREGMTAAEAL